MRKGSRKEYDPVLDRMVAHYRAMPPEFKRAAAKQMDALFKLSEDVRELRRVAARSRAADEEEHD